MTCGIYEIVNLVNGKRYVGSSVNIEDRWATHKRELMKGTHHARHLQNSYNIYGPNSYTINVIIECNRDDLIKEEQKELDKGYDYNSSPTAQSKLGLKFSTEARERVRQNRIQRYKDDPVGYSEMMSSLSKGKPKSDEWREKMRDRHSGNPKTESHVENMSISRADLTKEQVLEIRSLRKSGLDLKYISEVTGTSFGQCQRICSGKRYKWSYNYNGPVQFDNYASRRKKKAPS